MKPEDLTNKIEHFTERMRALQLEFGDNPDVCHVRMLWLMCETLRLLGFDEGVDIFKSTLIWEEENDDE